MQHSAVAAASGGLRSIQRCATGKRKSNLARVKLLCVAQPRTVYKYVCVCVCAAAEAKQIQKQKQKTKNKATNYQ